MFSLAIQNALPNPNKPIYCAFVIYHFAQKNYERVDAMNSQVNNQTSNLNLRQKHKRSEFSGRLMYIGQ